MLRMLRMLMLPILPHLSRTPVLVFGYDLFFYGMFFSPNCDILEGVRPCDYRTPQVSMTRSHDEQSRFQQTGSEDNLGSIEELGIYLTKNETENTSCIRTYK